MAVDPHPIIVGLSFKLSKGNPLYLSGKQAGLKPRRKVTGRCNFTSAISFFKFLLSNLEFQKRLCLMRAAICTVFLMSENSSESADFKEIFVTVKEHQKSECFTGAPVAWWGHQDRVDKICPLCLERVKVATKTAHCACAVPEH